MLHVCSELHFIMEFTNVNEQHFNTLCSTFLDMDFYMTRF